MDANAEIGVLVDALAEAFGRDCAHELAAALTCVEVDAFAALLRARGHGVEADMWVGEHALGDDPGDAHFQPDTTALKRRLGLFVQ